MKNQLFMTISGQRFPYKWLRDRCLCLQCQYAMVSPIASPTASHQHDASSSSAANPEPLSTAIEHNMLLITWKENPLHCSQFPITWLLDHVEDVDLKGQLNEIVDETEQLKQQGMIWAEIRRRMFGS